MSEATSNGFNELVSDLHPYNTPNSVMTDAVNATITTDGENQLILQNLKSTDFVGELSPGFQPLGVAVHKNISYIISGKFDPSTGAFLMGEIGTYPSPDWANLNLQISSVIVPPTNLSTVFLPLINAYSPLGNFISGGFTSPSGTGVLDFLIDSYILLNPGTTRSEAGEIILNDDRWYTESFTSANFDFQNDRLIEVELQESYDNSINILFTDNSNKVRLINSRFILNEDGKNASLANRRQKKDTNTYSDVRFFSSNLLKTSDKIADLNLVGVLKGGEVLCGNYKVYLKYIDTDGSLSDLIEESRLISVGQGDIGGKPYESSGKYIHLTLANLDYKFSAVKVYFSYFAGDTDTVGVLKEISNIYPIPSTGVMDIFIYGNELLVDISEDKLNLEYSSINTVKTFTQHDDRLVDANITNLNRDLDYFREIGQQIAISSSQTEDIVIKGLGQGYANANNVYDKLGIWAGETYEVAINFVLTRGRGVTPAFPLRGIDEYDKITGSPSDYTRDPIFPAYYANIDSLDGYYVDPSGIANPGQILKENRLGVYRSPKRRSMLKGGTTSPTTGLNQFGDSISPLYLNFDLSVLFVTSASSNKYATFIAENVEGFFFTRKERKKDCVAQGYITNTNTVCLQPITNPASGSYWDDTTPGAASVMFYASPTASCTLPSGIPGKIVPHPGQMSEFAVTTRTGIASTSPTPPGYPGVLTTPWSIPNPATHAGNPISFNFHGGNTQNLYSDPVTNKVVDQHFAFYTPDMLADAPYMASLFNNNKKSMIMDAAPIKMGSILDPAKSYNPSSPYNTGYFNNQTVTLLELNNHGYDPKLSGSFGYGSVNMADYYFQYINEFQDAFVENQFSAISNRNSYCLISNTLNVADIGGLNYTFNPGGVAILNNAGRVAGYGVDSTRYSDYIGIRCVSKDPDKVLGSAASSSYPTDLLSPLNTPAVHLSSYAGIVSALLPPANRASELWIDRFQFRGINFAVQANIYNSDFGPTALSSLTNSDWKNKYSSSASDESYFAFTKRITLADFRLGSPIYIVKTGGDCFINYVYKRAWYGHGIDGVPTASDPSLYLANNLDTGLVRKGLIFPMVCESNYNVSLRNTQLKEETEQALYGQERSFYPLQPISSIVKSRQLESKGYNFGYNDNNSARNYNALDDEAPAFSLSYDTRILVSAAAISGSFVNGYSDFSGLNFRDYAKNLGQITKIISQNGVLFCVQENGVAVVPMNQRTMVSEQQGGVFLDDGKLLGQKLQYISTEYGSDQQFSVIKSDAHIYGCTFDKNKIWRIEASANGAGYSLVTISDFKIQKILNQFKSRILNNTNITPFVKTNYDRRSNTVIFTFYSLYRSNFTTNANVVVEAAFYIDSDTERPETQPGVKEIGSIYFNETTEKWISKLSWNPMFMFNLGNDVYSFNAEKEKEKIWKHYSLNPITCNFYGDQQKFEFEFIIVDDSTRQKILNNLLVVCNREFPGRLTLTVDNDFNLELPSGWGGTPAIGSTLTPNIVSAVQPMRLRHEPFEYAILGSTATSLLFEMSIEEAERLDGAYFTFGGVTYVFGGYTVFSSTQLYIDILDQNLILVTSIPLGFIISNINFGTFKQNMEYIEDHLYIEIGNNKNNSRIRDKYIKVRFSYEGMKYVTIQKIISLFDYSFS